MKKELTYETACDAVISAARTTKDPNAFIHYAASYARSGKSFGSDEAKRVQALYILNNIAQWRGEEAKRVRDFFKEFSKGTQAA